MTADLASDWLFPVVPAPQQLHLDGVHGQQVVLVTQQVAGVAGAGQGGQVRPVMGRADSAAGTHLACTNGTDDDTAPLLVIASHLVTSHREKVIVSVSKE